MKYIIDIYFGIYGFIKWELYKTKLNFIKVKENNVFYTALIICCKKSMLQGFDYTLENLD